ncbi:hypothetical protein M2480_000203 [Parabacteroides sp. PFB2-12]|uniref:hypothetical protein n=1 Tax=unclassified Parabacteroides TaxID=2649774 RepID=UPI0024758BE7|nr:MULTISPECIES: hypothetical protein [unclassified Parabacteroides]MDH6341451.1 hypothetical protein [Parabacteroides sp. PM6-13]MDH6389245.1 hypothetical protein [Parabacteroides sp. PFB2-12]MDL2309781.1 hypothetical protein [Parabacteroides sp. OttesenSCG-928-B22]
MAKKCKGKFEALNPENKLFEILTIKNNPPKWWKEMLEDKDLYIEIRKDNYINVYYYGGCLVKISYNHKNGMIVETHQKYMGDIMPIGKDKKGHDIFEYRDCRNELTSVSHYLEFLKNNIAKVYLKETDKGREKLMKNKLTVSSEKKVQGELILGNRNLYIDSEFAYQRADSEKETIRFDLVSLNNGILRFIELKLISDPRLRGEKTDIRGEKIDIVGQMKKYKTFIQDKKNFFLDYYENVIKIKHKIGIIAENPVLTKINCKPLLLIVNNYSELTKGREERMNDIENILKKEDEDYMIINYPTCK